MTTPPTTKSFDAFRVATWVLRGLAVLGALLLALAILLGVRTTSWVSGAERTDAVITDVESYTSQMTGDSASHHVLYRPTVEFTTGEGRTVRATLPGDTTETFVGQRMSVLYDKDNPTDAKERSFVAMWAFPAILGAVGLFFLVIGGGLSLLIPPPKPRD